MSGSEFVDYSPGPGAKLQAASDRSPQARESSSAKRLEKKSTSFKRQATSVLILKTFLN